MRLDDLLEVLDITNVVHYSKNELVEKAVKENVSGISQLKGYSFKVQNKIYGAYHFSRNGHFELHFYDGEAVTSNPIRSKSKISLKVYSTIFKILLDRIIDGTVDQDIYIGYDGSAMKRIYIKLILHAFKKFDIKGFSKKLEYGTLPEGQNCIIIRKKPMMEACLTSLV